MKNKSRLLGLAFAAADTLLELDSDGCVAFVIGAGPNADCVEPSAWIGRPLTDQLGKAARMPLLDALASLKPGCRPAAMDVLVVCEATHVRRASLRLFQLPELAPAISCAISYQGRPFTLDIPLAPSMLSADGLLTQLRGTTTGGRVKDLAVSFIDVAGLDRPGDANARAAARIEGVLQAASIDGASAAKLAPERFAVLSDGTCTVDFAAEVREAGAAEGLSLAVRAASAAIRVGSPGQPTVRALRFALEACLKDDVEAAGRSFSAALAKTLDEAERFRAIVRDRSFELEYQPIVDLTTRAVHHHEALARFPGRDVTATIHLAEEMDLIQSFDLAVAERCILQLRQPGSGLAKVAMNLSGASLSADTYVQGLLRMTAANPDIRKRILVEVTETAAVSDMDAAVRHLTALRSSGIRVCLDDFGVGQSSLDYLHRLPADIVKIDGRFVQGIITDPRSQSLISHIVGLCADMNLAMIAEMIETEDQANMIQALGVGFGQGWLFGRPTPIPMVARPASAPAVRRQGAVVGWA